MNEQNENVFNSPRMTIDEEKYEKRKVQQEKQEAIEMLREEIIMIKRETEKNCRDKNYEGCFLKGPEMLDVDPLKLTQSDLLLFEDLKSFKAGKKDFKEVWGGFQRHKKLMAHHSAERAQKKPGFDFQKDS